MIASFPKPILLSVGLREMRIVSSCLQFLWD